MSEASSDEPGPPFTGKNPCPDCRIGLCHRCAEEKPDALPAPHMGVVLCRDCFCSGVKW